MKKSSRFLNKRSKGFTLAELTVVAAILGSITYFGAEQQEVKAYTNNLTAVEQDVQEMQLAYNQFYLEYRRPPADLAELAAEGFYTGPLISPFGTPYGGTASARGYQFTVNTPDDRASTVLAERQPNAVGVSATQVDYAVPVPTLETIASQYLHRTAIAGRPELNQMQTDLDINGFNITNVQDLATDSITTDRITTRVAEIDILRTVDELEFGTNSISAAGNTLTLNANTVNISNDLNVNGSLLMNNTNITGVNQLDAVSGQFDSVVSVDITAQTSTIDNLTVNNQTVNNLSSTNATIDNATVRDLTFDSATGNLLDVIDANVGNVETLTADINSATIDNLNTTSFNATTGSIDTLTSTDISTDDLTVTGLATINSADITNLVSNTVNAVNFTGNNGVINVAVVGALSSINTTTQNLVTDTLVAKGTARFDDADMVNGFIRNATVDRLRVLDNLIADSADFNRATGTRIDFTNLVGQSGNFDDLNVNGTITANNASINSATIDDLTTTDFNANNANIVNLDATNANVSGTLTTRDVTGQTANFSGNVAMNNLSVNRLTMASYNIDDINANLITADDVQGGNFSGTNYFATNDFTTAAGNSVNGNKALYDSINSLWQSCVASDGCQ